MAIEAQTTAKNAQCPGGTRPKWISTFVLMVIVALGLTSAAVAAPVFTNGDFSTLSGTAGNANSTMGVNGGYICANTGNSTCISNLGSWSSTCKTNACGISGTVASILFAGTNGAAFNGGIGLWSVANSPTGGNFIAIDGDPTYNASISQTVTGLNIGTSYAVSFYMAAAQQAGTTGANTEYWDVTFGSTTTRSQVISNTSKGFQPWRSQTMNFVATSTSQVLTFLAGGTPNGGPPVVLLDGITLVEVVPEPSSFLILAAGLATLVGFKKRKR
ncbi:MAG: PEP-CTERM sorting domain-containing protein [Bryobacteraceae bacterium]